MRQRIAATAGRMSRQEAGSSVGARGVSFENRIAISALVTAVVVLVTASGLFIIEQWQSGQIDLKRNQAALTRIVGDQLASAIGRGDLPAEQKMLKEMVASPEVHAAVVLDGQRRPTLTVSDSTEHDPAGTRYFETRAALTNAGQNVGELVVSSHDFDRASIVPRYLAVCGALFFAATGLALFMGRWLAGLVVHPVNRLSQAMRDVTDSGDYSQRVPNWARDEFGILTDSFNDLLVQLQANDNALHRAMTDLVEARDAAQAANVLKSQFLANMSHEIRTPLNGVLAMAQIIEMGELSGQQRERVEVIRRSGEELLAVLNDVLDISKIEAGKMELEVGEIDAEVLAANIQAAFAPLAEAKRNLSFNFSVEVRPEAAGLRRGDPVRMGQILNNLVSNAIKFTSDGEVGVLVEGIGPDGRDGLKLTVRDTGVGIAAEKLPLLFQKFSQADGSNTRRYGGTGLGLAICRELAQLMRGKIEVESAEGRGSTFIVTVPAPRLARAEAADSAEAAEPFDPAEERALRVLAAEDIPTNQLVLKTIMQSFGVEITMVDNGRQAVEAWMAEPYDLVLMDIQMPEMDGIAATRAIRAAEAETGRPHTPIIAVSANAMTHQVKEYLAAGMDGHVAKPIELSKLHAAIEAALADSTVTKAA
ncbi:MAG TPA: ATP-binding protein [Caulobacteraceae bacterium]|jgi:signal transduction histidine kinase/ActR/RegA family two-component response regulator|nr:ATP-binding protein [Caulobacteraceae bacterium]